MIFKILKIFIFSTIINSFFLIKNGFSINDCSSLSGTSCIISETKTDDYIFNNNLTNIIIIQDGEINGSITNGNFQGNVNIVKNYNTENTIFGSQNSKISNVVVQGGGLTITNDFYVNKLILDGSATININTNNIILDSIFSLFDNVSMSPPPSGIVNINVDYDKNTSFGFYDTTLYRNFALKELNINDGKTLNLKNSVYAEKLNINENSNLIIEDQNAVVRGIISGNGTLTINKDLNLSDTKFGSSTADTIANVNLLANNTLTLQETDAYKNNAYIDNLKLGSNSNLVLGKNSQLFGNVNGTGGNVIIQSNYTDQNSGNTVTHFGSSTSSLNSININQDYSLSLTGNAYAKNIILGGTSSVLNLNDNANVVGTIYGDGTVNINKNYLANDTNTKFGTETNIINNINITENGSLTLNNNKVFVNNLELTSLNSTLNIQANAGVNGLITGNLNNAGIINLTRNYDTLNIISTDYFKTTFGINEKRIDKLNIGNNILGNTLTLGNIAYINTISLNNRNSIINLTTEGKVVGTIQGAGQVNINDNYNTINVDGTIGNNTLFGSNSTSLTTLNINNGKELTLGNDAYIDSLNINQNSVLNLNDNSNIAGTIKSNGENSTVNVNSVFNGSGLGLTKQTYFGTSTNSITNLNINENGSLTLTTNSYLDNININSAINSTTKGPSLSIKADNNQTGITLNNKNGISYDNRNNLSVLISLKNIEDNTNNKFLEQLYDISKRLNSTEILDDLIIEDNNVYLDVLSKEFSTKGIKYFIDSNANTNYFNESSLVYETIFKNLKLETEFNATTGNMELYLVVEEDRMPTIEDVSKSTIISSNVIDSLTFNKRTFNENVLILNLQNIKDNKDFFHALTNISPDVSGLNTKIPLQSMISSIQNVNKRLSYFRLLKFSSITNNYNMKNLSKYDIKYYDDYFIKPYYENNAWVEGFAGNFHRDTIDNIFGYDSNYYGATLGYDVRPTPYFIFGLSYTFNSINAKNLDYIKSDRDEINAITNNADLYFMFYNKFNYITLNLGGSFNIYDQKRNINFYNFSKIATAKYDGFSYYAGVEYGVNILLSNSSSNYNKEIEIVNENTNRVGKVREINKKLNTYTIGELNNFVILTPKISLNYNNTHIQDYIEEGADAASLEVKTKDYMSVDVNAGLALTLGKEITKNINLDTSLNGFLTYSIIKNDIELEARYIENNEIFTVYGAKIPDLTFNIGIGFNFDFYNRFVLGLNYNYTFADGFNGMIGKITFLIAF